MRATSYLGDDVLPRAKKARAALGYLCLAFGARCLRARIASMLWDRVNAAQARTSFRQAVSELTSAMGSLSAELITTGRASIRFNTDACWIDALALLESSTSDATRTDLAVLCAGELLEGLEEVSGPFGQWLAKERVRFKERLTGSLDPVLQQIDRPGFDPKRLAAVARRLISFDPTHQGASRALMRTCEIGRAGRSLAGIRALPGSAHRTFRVKPSGSLGAAVRIDPRSAGPEKPRSKSTRNAKASECVGDGDSRGNAGAQPASGRRPLLRYQRLPK